METIPMKKLFRDVALESDKMMFNLYGNWREANDLAFKITGDLIYQLKYGGFDWE